MRTNRKNTRRRGMSAVEIALILPILVTLVMGVIESGNATFAWLTVQKAAYRGARFAVTGQGEENGTRLAQIVATTEASLVGLDKTRCVIQVRSWPDLDATGDGIQDDAGGPCQLAEIGIIYQYKPFTPVMAPLLPDTIPLRGAVRKVNEPWKPCD